jgi:NAD-dependent dihydropyrimidine dehydrogenase PreA subunit
MISIVCIICNTTNETLLESLSSCIQSVINQTFQDWELKIAFYNKPTLTPTSRPTPTFIFDDKRIEVKNYGEEFKTYIQTLLHVVNNGTIYNYIGILDVNDIWESNKLELQAAKLKEFPRIDVIGTKSRYDSSSLEPEIPEIPLNGLYNYNLFKVNPFINSSVVFKRDILRYVQPQQTITNTEIETEIAINPDKITQFCMNQLWLQLSIYESVLYNINQVTLIHKTPYQINHYNTCYESEYFKKVIADFKKKYIRIRFFSDFCTSESCKQTYERMCLYKKLDYYGKTKKIYITTTETYTHVFLLNCPVPGSLHVEKECVIGYAHEPPNNSYLRLYYNNFIEYAVNNIGKYFIGSVNALPSPPFIGHHGFLFHEIPKNIGSGDGKISNKKTKVMSIMVSQKLYTPGHKYRHELVSYILKHKLPIDIWGNGTKIYTQRFPENNNICGDFKSMAEMCENYMFTIAIENTSHDHYFTEKIVNPLIYDTIPLYWGCKKIEEYFPNYSIKLTGNINMDIITISRVLKNPQYFALKHKSNVEEVLDKVNLIKNVERLLC